MVRIMKMVQRATGRGSRGTQGAAAVCYRTATMIDSRGSLSGAAPACAWTSSFLRAPLAHFLTLSLGLFLALCAGSLLFGCAGTKVAVQESSSGSFEGERTYAWTGVAPDAGRLGLPAGQEDVAAEFRRALDEALQQHGFRKVGAAEARFRAGLFLGVEKETREADALFSVYTVDRIERGHAVLTLTEDGAGSPAWTGTASRVLRVTERGLGQLELRWTGTEEVRDWRVQDLAAALGARLP